MLDEAGCRLDVVGLQLRVEGDVLGRGTSSDVYRAAVGGADVCGGRADVAIKELAGRPPAELLPIALNECASSLLGQASRELGVLPCYGVVVGNEIDRVQLEDAVAGWANRRKVPVAVGVLRNDGEEERGGVALLMPVVEGAADSTTLASPTAGADHLAANDGLAPRAVRACVARAGLYLWRNNIRHRNIQASNLLLSGEFFTDPKNPRNCLLSDFGMAVPLDMEAQGFSDTPNMMHPLTYHLQQFREDRLRHHVVDLFGLIFTAFQLKAGGDYGNPLLRCVHPSRAPARMRALARGGQRTINKFLYHENAATNFTYGTDIYETFEVDIRKTWNERVQRLTADDLAGLAAYEAPICKRMLLGVSDRVKRYKPTQSDKRVLAERYALFDVASAKVLYAPLVPLIEFVSQYQPNEDVEGKLVALLDGLPEKDGLPAKGQQ